MKRFANYILLFLAAAFPVMTTTKADLVYRTASHYANSRTPVTGSVFVDFLANPAIFVLAGFIVLSVLGKELALRNTNQKIIVNGALSIVFGLLYGYTEYTIISSRITL